MTIFTHILAGIWGAMIGAALACWLTNRCNCIQEDPYDTV